MGEEAVKKKKIIIDTDPGVDDAMAIFIALESPEIEVIGLTTIFGNVYTTLATRNALHLLEFAGRTDIPVAEGSHVTITWLIVTCALGDAKSRIGNAQIRLKKLQSSPVHQHVLVITNLDPLELPA